MSGLAPAPKPLVILIPNCMRLSDALSDKDCASVLATTNSTPSRFEDIILLTALQPAPPTPITTIRGLS